MKIGRTYYFEAAHFLPCVPVEHKCRNMHGHNYRIEVVVRGPIDGRGFVFDFAELDTQILPLIKQLDHCVLNDVVGLANPTAENIALWFKTKIACESVRVYENYNCWAESD